MRERKPNPARKKSDERGDGGERRGTEYTESETREREAIPEREKSKERGDGVERRWSRDERGERREGRGER